MAKTDPPIETAPPAPALTEDERAELELLREANAQLRAENDGLREGIAEAAPRVTLTTDAVPSAADRRRTAALHEQQVMDRSEGARLDREQQENMRARGAAASSVLRSDGAVEASEED